MLTISGQGNIFGLSAFGTGRGLGEYVKGTDFKCAWASNNYSCKDTTRWGPRCASYSKLQQLTKNIAEQVPQTDAPTNTDLLVVDCQIGFITSTWVQFIGKRFAKVVDRPDDLAEVFFPDSGTPNTVMVERIAAHADEIYKWFAYVAENYPEAINPTAPPPPEVVFKTPKRSFKKMGIIVMGTAVLAALGYATVSAFRGGSAGY